LVIVGLGDVDRHDDGVGIAVVSRLRLLARRRGDLPNDTAGLADPGDLRFIVSDGEPTRLADIWADADVAIVVSCVRTGQPNPGQVHRRSLLHPSLDGRRVARSHGAAVSTALALSASLDRLPGAVVLYAVEPEDTSPGRGLTPAVAAAATQIADEISSDFIPA
jgi:hydrogenase maturation protease